MRGLVAIGEKQLKEEERRDWIYEAVVKFCVCVCVSDY